MTSPNPPSALLLLPPPPSAVFEQFQDAYKSSLSIIYSKLAHTVSGSSRKAILDIALSIPDLLSTSNRSRSKAFPYLQHFVATLYKLVGIVCVEVNVKLDVPGGIDTRVLFVDYGPVGSSSDPKGGHWVSKQGPTLDLQSLANSARPWDYIYYLDNKSGQDLATAFSSHSSATLHPVPTGLDWELSVPPRFPADERPSPVHHSVAVGGTFDHFHLGHKLLLTATALALNPNRSGDSDGERLITVGITGDELLVNKKYAEFLENWDERCNSVAAFLIDIISFPLRENRAPSVERISQPGPNGKYVLIKFRSGLALKLVQISDPFGPTITEEDISALVVSRETRQGGAAVNAERAKKGWKDLEVYEVDLLFSGEASAPDVEKSFEAKISSTEIRRHQMEKAKRS